MRPHVGGVTTTDSLTSSVVRTAKDPIHVQLTCLRIGVLVVVRFSTSNCRQKRPWVCPRSLGLVGSRMFANFGWNHEVKSWRWWWRRCCWWWEKRWRSRRNRGRKFTLTFAFAFTLGLATGLLGGGGGGRVWCLCFDWDSSLCGSQ